QCTNLGAVTGKGGESTEYPDSEEWTQQTRRREHLGDDHHQDADREAAEGVGEKGGPRKTGGPDRDPEREPIAQSGTEPTAAGDGRQDGGIDRCGLHWFAHAAGPPAFHGDVRVDRAPQRYPQAGGGLHSAGSKRFALIRSLLPFRM